jgi:hypothetical protein
MGLFSFMETSFFFTLGITFLLILLLVYHFKQRISNAESKQDTMFEIINNLVQEVSKTQQALALMNRPHSPYPVSLYSNFHTEEVHQELPQINEVTEVEDEDEEENEEVSYIDESDLDDSDDEMVDESDNDNNSMGNISIHEMIPSDSVVELTPTADTETIDENALKKTDFNKMNLGSLKTYILEQGWVEDASKMKKAQILSLIQEHSA